MRLCAHACKYRYSREHYIPLELELQMPVRHPVWVRIELLTTEESLSMLPICLYKVLAVRYSFIAASASFINMVTAKHVKILRRRCSAASGMGWSLSSVLKMS